MFFNRKAYNYCGHADKEDSIEDDIKGLNLVLLESRAKALEKESPGVEADDNNAMDVEKDTADGEDDL